MRHVIINSVLLISILHGILTAETPYFNRYPNVEELLLRPWLSGEMADEIRAFIQANDGSLKKKE
jgi:hypothetical protein